MPHRNGVSADVILVAIGVQPELRCYQALPYVYASTLKVSQALFESLTVEVEA